MKNYKKLNMNGTLLDKNQFAKHIEKTASEHGIKSFSNKNTYPIYRLMDDYKFILEVNSIFLTHWPLLQ